MKCPRCGKLICDCLLEDPAFLARAVGRELVRLESETPGLTTQKRDAQQGNGTNKREQLRQQLGPDYYCFATPAWVREAITREYGYPDLDVASSHDMHFGKRSGRLRHTG
jgi:hypothetical protein